MEASPYWKILSNGWALQIGVTDFGQHH